MSHIYNNNTSISQIARFGTGDSVL